MTQGIQIPICKGTFCCKFSHVQPSARATTVESLLQYPWWRQRKVFAIWIVKLSFSFCNSRGRFAPPFRCKTRLDQSQTRIEDSNETDQWGSFLGQIRGGVGDFHSVKLHKLIIASRKNFANNFVWRHTHSRSLLPYFYGREKGIDGTILQQIEIFTFMQS